MENLGNDEKFEIVRKLDYKSLNNLCIINKLFRTFCSEFQSEIYKYLLRRDYNVNTFNIQDDQAKAIYIDISSALERTINLLRQNDASKFADYIELDCILKPQGIKRFFSTHINFIILAPSNNAINNFAHLIESNEDILFNEMGNSIIANNIGFYNNNQFKNLLNNFYDVVPEISINNKAILHLGIVNNFVNLNIINDIFIDDDTKWQWVDHFGV
jgi:hypothetical protein